MVLGGVVGDTTALSAAMNIAAVATFDLCDDREAVRISLASIEAAAAQLARYPGVATVRHSPSNPSVAYGHARVPDEVDQFEGVPFNRQIRLPWPWHARATMSKPSNAFEIVEATIQLPTGPSLRPPALQLSLPLGHSTRAARLARDREPGTNGMPSRGKTLSSTIPATSWPEGNRPLPVLSVRSARLTTCRGSSSIVNAGSRPREGTILGVIRRAYCCPG